MAIIFGLPYHVTLGQFLWNPLTLILPVSLTTSTHVFAGTEDPETALLHWAQGRHVEDALRIPSVFSLRNSNNI